MECKFCNQKATYTDQFGRPICDTHADKCAKIGIVVREIHVPKPVPQADRVY